MKTTLSAAILFMALCLASPAGARDLIATEAFADNYIEELRAQAPGVVIRKAGRLHLEVLRDEANDSFTVFLDNAYKKFQASPEDRSGIIANSVAAMLDELRTIDKGVDVSRIVPLIKGSGYIGDLRQSVGTGDGAPKDWVPPAHEPFSNGLIIVYAEDTERSIHFLSEADLKDSGLDPVERRGRAVENLRALLPEIEILSRGGAYMVTAGGAYESSLLLFDDIWQDYKLPVKGELVIAVPARDVLLVTGSDDPKGLALVKGMAAEVTDTAAYLVTDHLLVYRSGKFEPFGG